MIDGCFNNLQYNSKEGSVKLVYEPQPRPRPIATLSGKTILKVACGTNHTGFVPYLFAMMLRLS